MAELGYVAFALDYHGGGTALGDRGDINRRFSVLYYNPERALALAAAGLDILRRSLRRLGWFDRRFARVMSGRIAVIERYFDGFRRSDHEQILGCLTDDVIWDLPGYSHLTGIDAFDQEIENDEFEGSPILSVDRIIEAPDTVVVTGSGETTHKNGDVRRFAFCDLFTFSGNKICRVESYLVPLI